MKPTISEPHQSLAVSAGNRRHTPRIAGRCPLTISYIDAGRFVMDDGEVTDLSHAGLGIRASHPLKPGMAVALFIPRPNADDDVCIPQAQVSWVTGRRFGVILHNLKPEEQERLVRCVETGHR